MVGKWSLVHRPNSEEAFSALRMCAFATINGIIIVQT